VPVAANSGGLYCYGFVFLGWDRDSAASVPEFVVTANSVSSATFDIYNDITLYTIWETATYTVTYQPSAHGTFAAVNYTGLVYGAVTPAAPTVTGEAGWNFTGWAPVRAATVTANVTYIAQWTQIISPSPSTAPTATPA
jgi:hypothetical protein